MERSDENDGLGAFIDAFDQYVLHQKQYFRMIF